MTQRKSTRVSARAVLAAAEAAGLKPIDREAISLRDLIAGAMKEEKSKASAAAQHRTGGLTP